MLTLTPRRSRNTLLHKSNFRRVVPLSYDDGGLFLYLCEESNEICADPSDHGRHHPVLASAAHNSQNVDHPPGLQPRKTVAAPPRVLGTNDQSLLVCNPAFL
eukprot:4151946-Pyramimonas_sp.AAC.2